MAARLIHLLCISRTVFMIIGSLLGTTCGASDDVVYTDLRRTARKGDELILKCDFRGDPIAIYWKKGNDPSWEPGPHNFDDFPSLIEKVDNELAGLCNQDMSCYMNSNFSLVIKSLQIENQGTYYCIVSNYRGLTYNTTTVYVFAPPMEPFPVISECRGLLPNDTCTMSTSARATITCSVSGYFPHIDLFFLQGSQKIDNTNSEEVTNLDETKNKSISTVAEPHEYPYVCVASNIPGWQDQRTVSIEVNFPEVIVNTTMPSQTTVLPVAGVAKKVVPVVIVIVLLLVVLCVAVLWWHRRKQRRSKSIGDPEVMLLYADPKTAGKISFYELWYLVQDMDATDLQKLKYALSDLDITVDEVPTGNKAYELLCEWKDTDTFDNDGRRWHNTLFGYGLGGPLERMTERRTDDGDDVISEERLDYIVRQFGNEKEFSRFLRELFTEQQKIQFQMTDIRDDFVKKAMEVMMKWRQRTNIGNHFILLSLALERAKYRQLAKTFFKVPEHLLKPILPQEVKEFVYGLAGRHCSRLGEAVGITDEKKIAAIINENNEALFDTQAMISDWIAEQECSHYEKRCMLDDAVIKIGRHDLTDSFGTTRYRFEAVETLETPHRLANTFKFDSIFDDDLAVLRRHLPPTAIPPFLEKLGISIDEEDTIEEKLRDWRDESIAHGRIIPLKKLCSIHEDVLEETNYNKVHDVKDDELENVLESITSAKQMEQLTTRLGIKNDAGQSYLQRIKEWRDNCAMRKRRKTLREILSVLGLSACTVDLLPPVYVYEVEMVRFAYYIICNDVEPLATLLDMDTSRQVKTVREPLKGTVGLLIQLLNRSWTIDANRRRDFSWAMRYVGYLDVARSAYFGYEASLSEIYNMTSELSKDEMEKLIDHLQIERYASTTTELHDNLNAMKIWRNQLRPEPIHFRLKLALALRAVGRDGRANDTLAGRFRTTEVCSYVVENICNNLDGHQMEGLCKHLKLKTRKAQEDQTTATLVAQWVRDWLNKFDKQSLKGLLLYRDKLIPRGKENDKLFRAGFFELAEEVMLLEVSKLFSVKPNESHAEAILESTESLETPSGDIVEVMSTSAERDRGDGAPGYQEATEIRVKEEVEKIKDICTVMARQMSGEMSVPHSEATISTKYIGETPHQLWSESIQSTTRVEETVPHDEGISAAHHEFIIDTPPDLILQKDEAIIACGIRFSPSGAKLTTPVKVTLDHNAHFTNPQKADIVFYTRSKGMKTYERIPSSRDGYPRCEVRAMDLDLYVDHFCLWWIAVNTFSRYFIGKRVSCTPYVKPPVCKGRIHSVILYIYDDLLEIEKKVTAYMAGYARLNPPKPVFVEWGSGDVVIKLFEGLNEARVKLKEMRMTEQKFYQVSYDQQSFCVPSPVGEANQKPLQFILCQSRSTSASDEINIVLEYDDWVHQSVSPLSPSPSSSSSPLRSPVQLDLEMDERLNELAEHMPDGKYVSFCGKLGIAFNTSKSILEKNKNDYCKATRECLADWKNKGGTLDDLKQILIDSGLRGLLCHLQETAL